MPGLLEFTSARLPQDLEDTFQRDMMFAPGWSNWRRDFIRHVGGAPNTDPGGDYNYRLAWLAGAAPEYHAPSDSYHGLSSAAIPPYAEPLGLKAPDHPTMWKEEFLQKHGFDPDERDAPWTKESARGLLGYITKNGLVE